MNECKKVSKGLAGTGPLAIAIMGLASPAFAASSATLQGDPITVAVGTFQTVPGGDSGYTLEWPASAHYEDGSFVSIAQSWVYDRSSANVYAYRTNADGSPAGSAILVNATLATQGSLVRNLYPSAAADANGNFAVTWKSLSTDGNSGVLKARLFAADGTPRSGEFCVDPACTPVPTSVAQYVAMQTDGNFTVAYVGNSVNGLQPLYFRRFAQDGTALDAQPVQVYDNTTFFSMALARGDGKLSFAVYSSNAASLPTAGFLKTSVHLLHYESNGKTMGFPVSLGACSAFYIAGEGWGCQMNFATIGSDAAGNTTVFWSRSKVDGTSVTPTAYLRNYYPDGFASGAKVTLDPGSMLANGFMGETGAGDLIARGATQNAGLQVFDKQGNPLGDVVASPAGFNISTDTSSNFVATNIFTTYGPNETLTTLTVQRYSIP